MSIEGNTQDYLLIGDTRLVVGIHRLAATAMGHT